MALIDSIDISNGLNVRRIELHEGDLTALTVEERTDLLVVSAYPDCCPGSRLDGHTVRRLAGMHWRPQPSFAALPDS